MDSYFGSVIMDCISLLNSLPSVSLLFVKRSANKAVHLLARSACSYADRFLAASDLDPSLIDVIKVDC